MMRLIAILLLFTSCNTVHKLFNKQRQNVDSTAVSTLLMHNDSTNTTSKYITVDTSKSSYINIIFSNTDTQRISTPIYVKVDSNGTYVINTGTRIVQSLTVVKNQINKVKTDSVGLIAVRNIKKKSDSTHVENNTTTILKEKKSSRFPIQIVAGIVALLGLVAAGIYINRKLKLNI